MKPIYYIVTKIDGDYAHLTQIGTTIVNIVARALLPYEIEEGTMLKSFMMEYEIVD